MLDALSPLVRGLFGALLVACLASCASLGGPPKTLTDANRAELVERVTARWEALERKDFAATWDFATPAYRAVFPRDYHARNFTYTVDWELTAVEVLAYDADAAVASVAVRVMSRPTKQTAVSAQFGAIPTTVREKWVSIDGEWWHSVSG